MRAECIEAVTKAASALGKKITKVELQDLESKIEQARKQLAKKDIDAYRAMSREEQLTKAGEMVVQDAVHRAIKKRQVAELSVIKGTQLSNSIERMMENGLSRMQALKHYVFFKADGKGGMISIESLAKARAQLAFGQLEPLRQLQNEGFLGAIFTDKDAARAFVKESYGEDSANPLAKAAWKAVSEVRKSLMDEFNSKGGDIVELANYRNPQQLDPYQVLKNGGKDGDLFVEKYLQWVDRNEYVNVDGTRMDDSQLAEFLRKAYTTLSTDGKNKSDFGDEGASPTNIANRMKAHRQIHYKSPEAYMAAMDMFASEGVFDQVYSSIASLARDITLLDQIGPKGIEEINRQYKKAINEHEKDTLIENFKSHFESFTGQQSVENIVVAHRAQIARDMQVANKLGSMLLSQFADLGTMEATARAMNIPVSQLGEWMKNIPSDSELRTSLRYMGLGVETALSQVARVVDGSSNAGFFGKAANAIPVIQGAQLWTRMMRQAFGAAMSAKMGDIVGKYNSIADLPEIDRRIMDSKGVTDTDWKIWQAAKPLEYNGSKLLGGDAIEKISLDDLSQQLGVSKVEAFNLRRDSAVKLAALKIEETQMAVLQPSELQSFGFKKGTGMGELGSLLFQFKSFGWAYFNQHLRDRANFEAAGYNPWVYRARLLATTTLLGGLAYVIGDLASGKDPRQLFASPDDPDFKLKQVQFATAALLKGGGLGFFGDVIQSIYNVAEKPYKARDILGPAPSYALGVIGTGMEGAKALYNQDEKSTKAFTKDLYDSVKNTVPGQNLWFIKGALHNVLLHELHDSADPGYADRARLASQKNFQNDYWLGMGQETRMPNFGTLTGQ